MSGVGGIINWDSSPVDARLLDGMMGMIRHRGPDGIYQDIRGSVGFGHALLALNAYETDRPEPVWLPGGAVGIAVDVRLYNRDELVRQFGDERWLGDQPSDAALILAAYARWGKDLLHKIDGDFVFVIWDAREQRIFAARDPFGARPLFYFRDHSRFLFGTEPKQILVMPDVPVVPNDMIIGEFLAERYRQVSQTFFEGVYRVMPGHYLEATQDSVEQVRYWEPDLRHQVHYPNTQDYFDQFRTLLRDSVRKRLQTEYPVASHLSGGLDSGSIVAMAADLYRTNGVDLPPKFETISAAYPGLSCDETEVIQAVTEHTSFKNHRLVSLSDSALDGIVEDIWRLDSPQVDVERATTNIEAQIMSQLNARVLITGFGGDELLVESLYLRDLLLKGSLRRFRLEARELHRVFGKPLSRSVFDSAKVLIPTSVKRMLRSLLSHKEWRPPSYWNADFAGSFLSKMDRSMRSPEHSRSLTQFVTFTSVTHPGTSWLFESLDDLGSYATYEMRYPFYDRALVEFVLAIPVEQRIAGDKFKALVRRGLKLDLPDEVLNDQHKIVFDEASIHFFEQSRPLMQDLLFSSGSWQSGRYISRDALRSAYGTVLHAVSEPVTLLYDLWRTACLELWLRGLHRYTDQKL